MYSQQMKEEQWLVKGYEVVLKAHVSTIAMWAKVETLLDNTTLQLSQCLWACGN